ncbi:MAG: DNA mismatch repair endonuclease MutL [Elusimicrobiota bacterium]|jgi:DNA mismatch repair protein MutL
MSSIVSLPEDVASRIAAGEVVERPASVLKELLENALDAGARRVDVEAEEAGRKLLRVRDDGRGMDAADCRAAFGRHATSKIGSIEDLDRLETFGFRGEALYAIAAVARVRLSSRLEGAKAGALVEVEGGRVLSAREAPPAPGTTVEVRDLFFNVPARRKFLRSEETERSALARVVEDAALANPEVAFALRTGPRAKLEYPAERAKDPAERHRARLGEVLGPELAKLLLSAQGGRGSLTLQAFFSPISELAATRQLQFLFVNRRPVACRALQQALYRAYEPLRPKDRHPVAALFLELPSEEVDVNVHPQKREVRFRRERDVFELVVSTLSRALLQSKGIPTLLKGSVLPPSASFPSGYSVAQSSAVQEDFTLGAPATTAAPHWQRSPLRWLGQIERAYLVFECEGGLLVVDQHAAQERVLFEKHMDRLEKGRAGAQRLMLPIPVQLPASAVERVLERRGRLKAAGFEVERQGKTGLQVTAVPELFEKAEDVTELVERALDHFLSPGAAKADARYDAAATMACKAAVKAHDPLGEKEAHALLDALKKCRDWTCCPHGRPTLVDLTRDELARRFGRSNAPPL